MGLQLRINDLEDVAEDLRDAYIKDGDGFIIDYKAISDHPGVKKIKNTADDQDKKRKEAEKLLKATEDKYGNVDLDAYAEAMKKIEGLDDQKLLDAGQIDELVLKKSGDKIADFEAKISVLNKSNEDALALVGIRDKELADIKIYDAIKDAALAKGARKDALQDISNRARDVWSLEDGKPVAKKDGDAIRNGAGDPISVDDWVDGLATTSDYLFEPNSGGGAQGNQGTDFGGAKVLSLDGAQSNLEKIASGEATINRG